MAYMLIVDILVHFGSCPAGQLSFLGLWSEALEEDVRLLQPHLLQEIPCAGKEGRGSADVRLVKEAFP